MSKFVASQVHGAPVPPSFLTKGCPLKTLVGFAYEIKVTGKPFKEHPLTQDWRSSEAVVGGGNPEHAECWSHPPI